MLCPKCKAQIEEDSNFCTNCGAVIERKDEVIQTNEENKNSEVKPQTPITINNEQEDNNKANILCFISLALKYIPSILTGIFYGITDNLKNTNNPIISLLGVGPLIAFVLMIVVRVKYPKNKFGKVLMWIYIVELIISLILIIVIVIACAKILNDCGQSGAF